MIRSLAVARFFSVMSATAFRNFTKQLLHGLDDEAKKLLKLGKAKYFRAINHTTNKNVVKTQQQQH